MSNIGNRAEIVSGGHRIVVQESPHLDRIEVKVRTEPSSSYGINFSFEELDRIPHTATALRALISAMQADTVTTPER